MLQQAIDRLIENPTDANRKEVYRQLTGTQLWLALRELPEGWKTNAPFTLKQAATLPVLTSTPPEGGKMLLAFTDPAAVQSRQSGAASVSMDAKSVLRLALDMQFDGIVINPGGGWVQIPAAHIDRMLNGWRRILLFVGVPAGFVLALLMTYWFSPKP